MYFFFFNDTATTEIYTRRIVGSVRCVKETTCTHSNEINWRKKMSFKMLFRLFLFILLCYSFPSSLGFYRGSGLQGTVHKLCNLFWEGDTPPRNDYGKMGGTPHVTTTVIFLVVFYSVLRGGTTPPSPT